MANDSESRPRRPRKSARRKNARKQSTGRNVDESKDPVHAPASDRTQPGGKYLDASGIWKNGKGQEIDEETGDVLDEQGREAARDARLAELDDRADRADDDEDDEVEQS